MPWFISLVSTLLGGLLALIGIWYKVHLDQRQEVKRARAIIGDEFADMARHFDRNVSRIRAIEYNLLQHDRWPDVVHLEKLKWPEDTFIFSNESIKMSRPDIVKQLYKMRLRIRNANLDADAAVRVFRTGRKELFMKALRFVEARHSRIEELALDYLGKKQMKRVEIDEEERRQFEQISDMLFFDRPIIEGVAAPSSAA